MTDFEKANESNYTDEWFDHAFEQLFSSLCESKKRIFKYLIMKKNSEFRNLWNVFFSLNFM